MNPCLLIAIAIVCVPNDLASAERLVSMTDVNRIKSNIENLAEGGFGHSEVQNYINDLTYDPVQTITLQTARNIAESISDKLRPRVNALAELQRDIQDQWGTSLTDSSDHGTCGQISLGPISYLHNTRINRDTWCIAGRELDSQLEFDFLPSSILESMKELVARDSTAIKRVYLGSEKGVLTTYPASRLCPDPSCDALYDPRFQPWYVTTATPNPKDVVIVMDRSNSMETEIDGISLMGIAHQAAATVLLTLSPNDRVGIVIFSDEVKLITDFSDIDTCYSRELAKATPDNIAKFKNFMSRIDPQGGTRYSPALAKAFEYFQNTPDDHTDPRRRDKVILMLSDGAPDDEHEEIREVIKNGNALVDNQVVILTYGIGEIGDGATLLENLAEQEFANSSVGEIRPGRFVLVSDIDNLRYEMGSYYNLFKSSEGVQAVQYTVPYLDNFDTGLQISMCLQIIVSNELKGVVCIDQPLEEIVLEITNYRKGDLSYGFIIDSQSRVMTHPLLPNPHNVHSDVAHTYLAMLERGPLIGDLIEKMIRRENGSIVMTSQRVAAKGSVTLEGVSASYEPSEYFYFPIAHTNFSLCIVNAQNKNTSDVSRDNWVGVEGYPEFVYHKDLHQETSRRDVCRAATRVAVRGKGSIKLAPRSFINSLEYIARTEVRDDLQDFVHFFEGEVDEDERFQPNVREMAATVEHMNHIFSSRTEFQDSIIWRYFGTDLGVHITYPGIELPSLYDPAIRPWYTRALYYPRDLVITTPYVDAFGAGVVLTVTRLIHDKNTPDLALGVLGLDLSLVYIYYLITAEVSACQSNTCFVVDEAGFIVVHKDWLGDPASRIEEVHITSYEARIAGHLTELGVWTHRSCVDIEKIQTNTFGKISLDRLTDNYLDEAGWFEIHEIAGTNIFLVVKKGPSNEQQHCDCPVRSNEQFSFRECSSNYECTCPCYEPTQLYEYCPGVFSLDTGSDNPPPCTPPIPSIDWDNISPTNGLDVDSLEYCHDYRCPYKTDEVQCRSTLTCRWCVENINYHHCDTRRVPRCVKEDRCHSDQTTYDVNQCTSTSRPTSTTETSEPGVPPPGPQGSSSNNSDEKDDSLPEWAIAIITVVLLLVIAVIVAAVVIIRCFHQGNRHDYSARPDADPDYYDIRSTMTRQPQTHNMQLEPRPAVVGHQPAPDQRYMAPAAPAAGGQQGVHINDSYITTGRVPDVASQALHGDPATSSMDTSSDQHPYTLEAAALSSQQRPSSLGQRKGSWTHQQVELGRSVSTQRRPSAPHRCMEAHPPGAAPPGDLRIGVPRQDIPHSYQNQSYQNDTDDDIIGSTGHLRQ